MVDITRDPLQILRRLCRREWKIYLCSMWYVCEFYTTRYPMIFRLGKFVIYIYCAGVIMPLHLNYICIYVDIFVNHITVSALICFLMLYNIIIGCTSYWGFCTIFLLLMVYPTTALSLHLRLNKYFHECYIYVY